MNEPNASLKRTPAALRGAELVKTATRPATPVTGLPYWPALDGLRGTAILAVLTCHYTALLPQTSGFPGLLENGWAGVDLFFVLSGFLITGILLRAKESPHYFLNFYARRILRIFPLYYGFLAAVLLVLLISTMTEWNSAGGMRQLWSAQPWLWTYTANFWIAAQKQWGNWAEIVIPLWSLSVEEQFYLIWPLVIFYCSPRALIGICLGIMIGALSLRLILTACGTSWFALYTWTPTRADSLAAGALLAVLMQRPDSVRQIRKIARYAGVIAGVLLLLISPGFDPTRHAWLRDVLYSVLAIFFAALLFWSIDPRSFHGFPKRFYEHRVLRITGKYSYGIYIIHLPLMYLSTAKLTQWRMYDPNGKKWIAAFGLIALNVTLTFCLAFLSYNLYEKQFLKLKRHFPE